MKKSLSTDMLPAPHPLPPEGKMFPGEHASEVIILGPGHPGNEPPTGQADGVAKARDLVGFMEDWGLGISG